MTASSTARKAAFLLLPVLALTLEASAQGTVITFAEGLTNPIGLEIDDRGRLWVAQQGTASNDGRISIVTPDGEVHPFLVGLPSETLPTGELVGPNHVYFDGEGNLIIVQSQGSSELSAALLLVDTTGFVPGDPPLSVDDVHTAHDIGTFVLDQDAEESNPYTLSPGPDGDLFVVDAGANLIVRRASATGELSVFATFPDVTNDTGIGPPMVNAVPTGITLTDDRFFVGSLTGFPFGDSAAAVYEVNLEGEVSVAHDSLTTIVDIDVDPVDGALVVLQHAAFAPPPPPFLPNSGGVFKLKDDGGLDTLAFGLNRPAGLRIASNGDAYVTSLADGTVLRIEAVPTAREEGPEMPNGVLTSSSYPNPFSTEARIRFDLAAPGPVSVTIVNLLGQEVRRLFDGMGQAGTQEVVWDGRNSAGTPVVSGVYLYRIRTEQGETANEMVYLRDLN